MVEMSDDAPPSVPPPPTAPSTCTCPLGVRADIADLNAALATESLSSLHKRLGISKSTLHRHRTRCLRLPPAPFQESPPPVQTSGPEETTADHGEEPTPDAAPAEGATDPPDETPAAVERPPVERVPLSPARKPERPRNGHGTAGTEKHRRPLARTAPKPPRPPVLARVLPDADQRAASLIRRIADVVAAGEWKGWATAVGLAQQLHLPIEEVLRLHQLAAGKVGEARGTQRAQRESAVAATRRMRDEERDDALRYDTEARESYEKAKAEPDGKTRQGLYLHARNSRKLAGSHRRAALEAQKHLDTLTVLKPPAITVNVSYSSSPDFQLAFKALGEAADAFFGAGASRRLEQALGVLEDDGPEAFAAFLEERKVVVVEGADGGLAT